MNLVSAPLELSATQRNLIDLIRNHGTVTRAELSRLSGLTPGAITQQCRELIFSGLIIEGEPVHDGKRGQPSLPLRLNPGGACSVGVSFSPGFIDIAVIDLSGKPLIQVSEKHTENCEITHTVNQVIHMVAGALKKKRLSNSRILGIGYAVPGFLKKDGRKRQTVAWLDSWREVDLQAVFSAALPYPTWVENIVNASAIAEYYSGNHSNISDLVLIDLGYGIAAGIIADSKLLSGGFSNAGELGMSFPLDRPRPSYKDLLITLEKAGLNPGDLDGLYDSGNTVIECWIARVCEQLEPLIFSCIQWLDPEVITLGGAMPKQIVRRLVKELNKRVRGQLEALRPSAQIEASAFSKEGASRGAAMLPLYYTLNIKK